MSQSLSAGSEPARRQQIEAALADYPHLSEESLAAVLRWFRSEASAYDVAMVASNEAISESYRRFRDDHIDRLTGKDVMKGLLYATPVVLAMSLIIWWVV